VSWVDLRALAVWPGVRQQASQGQSPALTPSRRRRTASWRHTRSPAWCWLTWASRCAPRPRLERGTYCLGVHFMVSPDLDVSSSEGVCSAFEW